MSSPFPFNYDDDTTIFRVDDNVTEIGGTAINQLRDAVFAVERSLGREFSGNLSDLASFLSVSFNENGHIRASELTSVGLATLPIVNSQVASNAGIEESKLDLDYSTSDLHTGVLNNSALIASLVTFANQIFSDLILHITGSEFLSDSSTKARHVASQIDINAMPSDTRDPSYTWTGLLDKDGNDRSADTVADALLEINDDLVDHENSTSGAHNASAIVVNTDNFVEIPLTATDVQKALDYLDDAETYNLGQHRATQHANAVAPIARSSYIGALDGYAAHGSNVVSTTRCQTFLTHSPNTGFVDDLSVGDDLVRFFPNDNTGYIFDAQFSQVQIGDQITINYGNGTQADYLVDEIRFIPNTEWIVRINGVNLCDATDAIAQINRPSADKETFGILATAPVNAYRAGIPVSTNVLSSMLVAHPRGASALGIGFDPGQLNSSHYLLYLALYPNGNPADQTIVLNAIDVTGNSGATPGNYTLESVVLETNNSLHAYGYSMRFLSFAKNGNFGIMLADCIGNAGFSIISGDNSSGTLDTSSTPNNVIGGGSGTPDSYDALGLGSTGSNSASPEYLASWTDSVAAQFPTKVLVPLKQRYYHVNGRKLDTFADTYLAIGDGYWDGYVSSRTVIGVSTVETSYTVLHNLAPAGMSPGKTLVIQPTIVSSDPSYNRVDYGRFIIKNVAYVSSCDTSGGSTVITVLNSIHSGLAPVATSAVPSLPVKIYFGYDSVSFNNENLVDTLPTSNDYQRWHEIYVTDQGKTFSHERARLPRQTESATLLATTNWHISSVSPKLRGYLSGISSDFQKRIRFYVTEYNSTTGEYDGYLGVPISGGPGISNPGPVTRGRKNVPTRFFDETYSDYIDLTFQEISASPGTDVLSNVNVRYVDIDLYPSLQLNDQYLLLATCEVNWDPVSTYPIIQKTNDARQFGSVDEVDFTQSAIDFITSGDALLHENGVLRGLGVSSVSAVADSGEVYFDGGIALVNGKIVIANNSSVTIPQIYTAGTSLPQPMTYVICINESGELTPLILTTTKQQYFVTPGSGNYYLPSVTFFELLQSRKDLTPLAIIAVTVASLTVDLVTDVRRFVHKQSSNNVLTWVSDNNIVGNFYDFTSLTNWINFSDGYQNEIQVKGAFDISTTIPLVNINKKIIIRGLNGVFNCTAAKSFEIDSNVLFEDCTFNYNPTGLSFSSPADLLNVGNACLYSTNVDCENTFVNRCTFTSRNTSQRPPFILFELITGQTIKNVGVTNCSFIDEPISEVGKNQAAAAFYHLGVGFSPNPSCLLNVRIENNFCSHQQGFYMTTELGTTDVESPGMNVVNSSISKNICGSIGYVISGDTNASTEFLKHNVTSGLTIENNTCFIIGNFFGTGNLQLNIDQSEYGFGRVSIKNNYAHWISVQTLDITDGYSSLLIDGNHLDGYDSSYLSLFTPNPPNYAIFVAHSSSSVKSEATVVNNHTNFGRYNSLVYGYDTGVDVQSSGIITGNIVRGLKTSGTGIRASAGTGSAIRNYTICQNQIYRSAAAISAFIRMPSGGTKATGICTDNFFDSTTIDGSSLDVAPNASNTFVVTRNKNQTFSYVVPINCGNFTINLSDGSYAVLAGNLAGDLTVISQDTNLGDPLPSSFIFNYLDLNTANGGNLLIPLLGVLPEGVTITACQLTYNASTIAGTNFIELSLRTNNTDTNNVAWANAGVDTTLALTVTAQSVVRYGFGAATTCPYLIVTFQQNHSSGCTLKVKDITISFVY